ncbi:hypothetical protein LTR09_003771 [Extremus antarcticus]|uniref:Uncharacterized protein n=1 Tax=Extremus antarcticus TaxID=702011 RepID=A0AAJ0DQX9_9PEZI|nr:hypothetical protein LTR09_003771 [Extremus antarcticus]
MTNGKEREESPRDEARRDGERGGHERGRESGTGSGAQRRLGNDRPASGTAGVTPRYQGFMGGQPPPAAQPAGDVRSNFDRRFRNPPRHPSPPRNPQGFGRQVSPPRSQQNRGRLSPPRSQQGFGWQVSPPRRQENRGRQPSEPRRQQDHGRRPSLPRTPATPAKTCRTCQEDGHEFWENKCTGICLHCGEPGSYHRGVRCPKGNTIGVYPAEVKAKVTGEDERQQLSRYHQLHERLVREDAARQMRLVMLRRIVAARPYGGAAPNVSEPPRSDPGRQEDVRSQPEDVRSPPEDIETDEQAAKKATIKQRRDEAAEAYVKTDPPEDCLGPARKRFLKAERNRKQAYLDELQAQWEAEYDLEAGRAQGESGQGAGDGDMDFEQEEVVDPSLTMGNLADLTGGLHTAPSRAASVVSIESQLNGNNAFSASDGHVDQPTAYPGVVHAVHQPVADPSAEVVLSENAAAVEAPAVAPPDGNGDDLIDWDDE